ncbi:hypothetical protein [Superficieibacter sp. HKU1]|jgi:hypothetical protein|uniref:hypothetical protein n=1 Tax=Superficieibacter sp. HKU1 TaxID=3031919 RepID=UPI0023E1D46D|nr:hypothetical protein [Superficieibacter sp. HKU1]WES69125.1 hypothetical protein P0H77_03690 [Superficieibacter sp. HKU1]
MSNGKYQTIPRPGAAMTYRQHLVAMLAPVILDAFLNQDAWCDYDEMAGSLMHAVDAIIEAEQETTE